MDQTFSLTLRQEDDYRFVVDFGQPGIAPLMVDEPPPLGEGTGPNPARLLGAAVASCLSSSLLFCMRKARLEPGDITTTVEGTMERDDRGRLRIGGLRVRIHPTLDEGDAVRAGRCMDIFEDFCIVTQSVRAGIDIDVAVEVESEPLVDDETRRNGLIGAGT